MRYVFGLGAVLATLSLVAAGCGPNPGTPDTSFSSDGAVTTPFATTSQAFAVGVDPNGKVVSVGQVDQNNEDLALARYTSTGSLDTIRNDAMARALKFRDALDPDGGGSCAFDLRAHFVEQVRQVGHFWLASAIPHDGFALCQCGGHQQVFGPGYGNSLKNNFPTT